MTGREQPQWHDPPSDRRCPTAARRPAPITTRSPPPPTQQPTTARLCYTSSSSVCRTSRGRSLNDFSIARLTFCSSTRHARSVLQVGQRTPNPGVTASIHKGRNHSVYNTVRRLSIAGHPGPQALRNACSLFVCAPTRHDDTTSGSPMCLHGTVVGATSGD